MSATDLSVLPQGVRTPTLQLSALQEGDYTFQLTVTDTSGQQDTAKVTVIVQPGKKKITSSTASYRLASHWECMCVQAPKC